MHHRRSAGMGGMSAAIGELTLLRCITAVAKLGSHRNARNSGGGGIGLLNCLHTHRSRCVQEPFQSAVVVGAQRPVFVLQLRTQPRCPPGLIKDR